MDYINSKNLDDFLLRYSKMNISENINRIIEAINQSIVLLEVDEDKKKELAFLIGDLIREFIHEESRL